MTKLTRPQKLPENDAHLAYTNLLSSTALQYEEQCKEHSIWWCD